MVDFKSTPTESEDPYKKLKVSGVEEKKYTEEYEEKFQKKETSKKETFLSYLAKKLISFFPRGSTQKNLKILENDLSNIHKYFQELANKDLSQDITYLKKLSACWQSFFNNFISVALNTHPIILQIRSFFDQLHSYPDTQHFSLGYYLTEYAGEKWIPFPFMEMLSNLHKEYQADADSSHLYKWMREIEDIIKFK